ncbi:filamentous hemagglutinin N-terminal domain-containing protein [Betaproteobacteria bacterium SCN1]|nr:filamentous hemagglutinin N-terminal domain-containing protein [Betaproteobacteria bacterium SCN1]
MNRNRYRLVFNAASGMRVPVAETARRRSKTASGPALALAGVLLTGPAGAELPVPGTGGGIPDFVTAGQASYQINGTQAYVNQVGGKAILNWQSFNLSPGHSVQFRQVENLATNKLVQGTNFTSLNRIWDMNPSVIAGSISQAAGQKANVILVNANGIAFMNGSQVNLNSFTASTLNMQDRFLDTFLPQGESQPQFENALDGSAARGFVKVMDGARITAGSQGRVMLIAPTVVNRGTVAAPDGQVIAAAASRVYLRSGGDTLNGLLIEVDSPAGLSDADTPNAGVRDGQLDGQTVRLTDAAEDRLGHVANFGELTTPRGNVTMVGYAVNQQGIARATTSVVAGGSVYLLAQDTATNVATNTPGSTRAGRVTLGANSLTEVLPETGDTATTQDGAAGTGLEQPSRVRVLGQDVRIEGSDGDGRPGARIVAPSGVVELLAVDNPNSDYFNGLTTDIFTGGSAASATARLHIGGGAHIDVSGLRGVEVSANRSVVEVELRGDELKDSPLNQIGPLRGQKIYIDVDRMLAESDAGQPTLVARDTLLGLKAQQQRTVAERSTAGGTVRIASRGEAVVESGAAVDLSGGSLKVLPGQVKTTLLNAGGRIVDASEARPDVRYDGIATRYVIDYGRWNRQEVIDLGQSLRYASADVEGADAGMLETFAIGGLFAQPSVVGATTRGERQRLLDIQPRGARWVVGYDDASDADRNQTPATGYVTQDFKLNQDVILAHAAASLPSGFRPGDVLPVELKSTLSLDTRQVANGRVAELSVLSNQAVTVRDAIRAPDGGALNIVGANVEIGADLASAGGTISVTARNTAGRLADALPMPNLAVTGGVTISTRGVWINEQPGRDGPAAGASRVDGGRIALRAESVSDGPGSFAARGRLVLGEGVELDADGGARLDANGRLHGGKGGDIVLAGFGIEGFDGASAHAYGTGEGGALEIGANRIEVGGTGAPASGLLALDSGVFSRGGFARYTLNALSRLEIAAGAQIAPTVTSRDLLPEAAVRDSGANVADFGVLAVRDATVRQAAALTLRARQNTAQTGDLVVGTGARIALDPGAALTLDGLNGVDIDGVLIARGGAIAVTSDLDVGLGAHAALDASGIAQTYPDTRGLTQGTVRAGGTVALSGARVAAETGSRIDVSGAAPVWLDVPNETGAPGRMVGSEAGAVTVYADGAIRLDGAFDAAGGDAGLRGGLFSAALGEYVEPGPGQPLVPARLRVGARIAPGQNDGETRIDAARLENAGFDRIHLSSRDAIVLENGLDLGAAGALPLRELRLDAAAILTAGGDATLRADALTVGNLDPIRRAASSASTSTGTLALDARLLDLVGTFDLGGMARAELTGREAVRFSGTTAGAARPAGEVRSAADLAFHGAVMAPASYTRARIAAPGRTVSFDSDAATPAQPFSAQGSLTVEARDIVQAGNVWAPLGQLDFRAADTLAFADGSLTSVAAAPGSLLPFGKIQNGRTWVVDLDPARVPDGQQTVGTLDEKSIRTTGATVDMRPGAKFDLAGGGDLQAYEFTVGPGGSRDLLADAGTYAILPGYTGGFAPADPQEGFDRASGEAVYLSGVPGLADGVYTLLPAHYALLPGAYAVKLGEGSVLPGQAYTRQDGIRVAAGYVTDTRAGAPRDAGWQGVQVMTREQVRARSEFALVRASQFFARAGTHPQDAGLLSIRTTGSGADALKLDAIYDFAPGTGGRGGQVDISALKLAVSSGAPGGFSPDTVVLDAGRLNALGADSLLLGATRTRTGETTAFDVGAQAVTLANDATHALKGGEIMLAATDAVTLKAGSAIEAGGTDGDAGHYTANGNGAFVRAASTVAGFSRTGSPDRSAGTLVGEAGSTVQASAAIVFDATRDNAFHGAARFERDGAPVAGNLAVGATRINFGSAPAGVSGLTYSQAELDALDLAGLTLTSYSSFDLYGDVTVGRLDAGGRPVLQRLTLQGAGLAGIGNAGVTARINAGNLALSNPDNTAAFAPGGPPGSGMLEIHADTLTLGTGDKRIAGFDAVAVSANEIVGSGAGRLDADAPLTLNTARIVGERGADQHIEAAGALAVTQRTADRTLAPVTAPGAKWALSGARVDFDSRAELPSGSIGLTARAGDVRLGAHAAIDVAGRRVAFFDAEQSSWGGTAAFVSETGQVDFATGARVDVSAAAGSDAGTLAVRAVNGTFAATAGSLRGMARADSDGVRGAGAYADIDVGTLADFSALNAALDGTEVSGESGFGGERSLRVRGGDLSIAAGDTVRAQVIRIAADAGDIGVAGTLDASGEAGGRIALHAGNDLNVLAGAVLLARSGGADASGGVIGLGSRDGALDLAPGSTLDVSGGTGGTVHLRARRDGNDVAVGTLGSAIVGARAIDLEAVRVYDGIDTLNATGASGGGTLTLAAINADNTAYAASHGAIETRLGVDADPRFHLLSGVEVRSPGDLTLAQDWNLKDSRAGGEAGVLTLRAAGDLKINANLSDGFSHATPCTGGACPANNPVPATMLADRAWSYRLVAGADAGAADPLAAGHAGDVGLAAGKLVRTGAGSIDVAAGRDISLADASAALYSAGRLADPLAGFTAPFANLRASYTVDGGDVRLSAGRDVVAKPSAQLFSQWLYRQGAIDPATGLYVQQPSWWVRFDQFRQGVGALGGGNLTVAAGGDVRDLSASLPTQARIAGTNPADAEGHATGGGTLSIAAGGDVLGGSYYVGRGELDIRAGGAIRPGSERINSNTPPLAAIVALGDARARLRANADVNIGNIVSPHLLPQSAGNLVQPPFGQGVRNPRATLFSTYGADAGLEARSLAGDIRFGSALLSTTAFPDLLGSSQTSTQNALVSGFLPPALGLIAYLGDVTVGVAGSGNLTLSPSPAGTLDILAGGSIALNANLALSDMDPRYVPDAVNPLGTVQQIATARPAPPDLLIYPFSTLGNIHASVPVHAADRAPARLLAATGDIVGVNQAGQGKVLNVAKAVDIRAGRDIRNLSVFVQHSDAADISRIEAGRDFIYDSTSDRRDRSLVRVGGPGRIEIVAGRDIDLGTSGGIVSRGNIDNANLPAGGAGIHLAAGVGAGGIDYDGALDRLLAALLDDPDDATLWQARWLAGDATLDAGAAVSAVRAVRQLDAAERRARVRDWQFAALRETGRDANRPDAPYAGDFSRGYAALAWLFPGIEDRNAGGGFARYAGDINLFASRVKSENGGAISFLAPGGDVIVGLPNTPAALVDVGSDVLGIVAAGAGDVSGAARGDMRVNQSRILTVGGGDVLLWSSEGDIDAGKGKKTASAVPPPIVRVDAQGNITLEQQGAVTGSGIGALFVAGGTAGDVDLVAPKGTVDAGDAGIRAGNLNIAAQVVLGADNISVSGTSTGTPVADAGVVTAAASGASNAGGDVSSSTAALAQNLAEAARTAEALKQAFKPTFISAEVIGHGE